LSTAEAHEFFKGKTIRIVVGFTAGGAFDVYSRTMARHQGQYIPGNPAIIVDNKSGAGSLLTVNHIYKAAAHDGLSVGNFIGGLFVGQILGRPGLSSMR
jgi:tripartite-type tricarboxylate transporter receptor subunit TctC